MHVSGSATTRVDLVTLALYLCEGDSKLVDTEDVASKAHELNPQFFRWRTRESIFQSKDEPEIGPGGKGQAAG